MMKLNLSNHFVSTFLFVFVLVLPGCGLSNGAENNTAEKYLTTVTEFIFIEDTMITHSETHKRVGQQLRASNATHLPKEFLITAHRIEPGSGTVLIERTAKDDTRSVDEEFIRKLTVYVPGKVRQRGAQIVFRNGVPDAGGIAVLTDALIAWGSGCLRYAWDGQILIYPETNNVILAEIDIEFFRLDAKDWRSSGDCPPINYKRRVEFKRKNYQHLSPWEGRADGEVIGRERWPGL